MNKRNYLAATVILVMLSPIAGSVWCQTPDSTSTSERGFGWSLIRSKGPRNTAPLAQRDRKAPTVSSDADTIRVDTDLVINDVLVFDKNGRQVEGLTRDDFVVLEDGMSQDIASFSHNDAAVPRFVILIIDHSVSQLPYLERSVEAAKVLVDKLNPNDRMAIVTDDVMQIAGPTSDKTSLKVSLESLKASTMAGNVGSSLQYSALYAVFNELVDSNGVKPVIIFQTDGDELATLQPGRIYQGIDAVGLRKFKFDDILRAAQSKGVTAYTVFSGISLRNVPEKEKKLRVRAAIENETRQWQQFKGIVPVKDTVKISSRLLENSADNRLRDEKAVSRIAEITGGIAQTLESADQAGAIYERILSDMNRRYVICYYPTDISSREKRRQIRIEVRGHPEYKIWGQKSYALPTTEEFSKQGQIFETQPEAW